MLRIGVIMYQTSLTKGQELVAQRMVKEFRRQGHEAFLITSIYHDGQTVGITSDEVKGRGGYVHLFDRTLGIPVIRLSSSGASWPPRRISFEDFIGNLTKIVEELGLNVLITNSTLWNGPEEVVKFVRWRRTMIEGGVPYHQLVFCHMSHFQEPSDERYAIHERSYRETWNNTVLPQIMNEADIILTTTPLESESMKKFGASSDKIMLFPGGIEDEAIMAMGDAKAFRASHGLDSGTKIVSYLGTVEERKNPLALLDVARILSKRPDVRFVIAGKLEGEYGARVKEESSRLPNVSVVGPLSEQDKASLIRASFANIMMSRSESLGIAQLEFMSMGVPVITSGAGGQSWIIRNGSNGVVLKGPDDIRGAADAIERLADNPSERKKTGRNAARFASGFSITRLVDALSKRLEGKLKSRPDAIPALEWASAQERVIEAWVDGGRNVVATTGRLMIRSVKSGREAITIPYSEITKVVRYIKASWSVLGIGILVTLLLLTQRILGLGLLSRFVGPTLSMTLSILGLPGLASALLAMMPFLPVFLSIGAFVLTLREGFLVYYGTPGSAVFLPKTFVKALRLADRLTPTNLFASDDS